MARPHPRPLTVGRHELGQNYLIHQPSIDRIIRLVTATRGPILELGAGGGALTRPLSRLGRDLRAVDIDDRCVAELRRRLPGVDIRVADALHVDLTRPVIVGNIPFHLTYRAAHPVPREVEGLGPHRPVGGRAQTCGRGRDNPHDGSGVAVVRVSP